MAEANKMAMEFARRRELAHRQKLARLGSLSENSCQDPLPLRGSSSSYQARATNPTSRPMPTSRNRFGISRPLPKPVSNRPPNPFSKPLQPQNPIPKPTQNDIPGSNPRPYLSGTKRKETITNSQDQTPQKPRSSASQLEYITTTPQGYSYCNICEVPLPGLLNLQQHLKGNPHKNKLQLLEWTKKGISRPFCNTCKIYCTDEGALKLHYNGKKHKSKLQKIESGGEKKYHRACDLCEIFCMDEDGYQQHLRGKKHIARVYAAENTRS